MLVGVREADSLPVTDPSAPGHQGVHMRMPVAEISRGLHHGYHPWPQVTLPRGSHHQFANRLPGRAREPAEQLPVVQEVRPQHLRHHEHPLRVPDLLQHLFAEQGRGGRRAPGRTRRAQLTHLARKGEQVLRMAVGTPHAGEAVLKQPAVQIPLHLLVDEAPPEPVPALEALLPLPPHLVVQRLEKAVQGCRARVPRPVQATRLCGQDDAPCLPQRGGTSTACPHFD